VFATRERMRQAERQLAEQAQASYERSIRDWQASGPKTNFIGRPKRAPDAGRDAWSLA
jgi:hypothetical protein